METPDHVAALSREGAPLAAAAGSTALDAPVPGCPGWSVADLLQHLGVIHHRVAVLVRAGGTEPPFERLSVGPAPSPELRAGWLAEGHGAMVAALEEADPRTAIWTWAGPGTVGWWARRMAVETAVHRWDLQSAGGSPGPIEAALAADGIDELFEVFVPARHRGFPGWEPWRFGGRGERLHLHCTDVAGEWVLRFGEDDVEVTREHAKGQAALRGPASDMLLALYGRVGVERLELLGDPAVVDLWTRAVSV